MRSPKFFLVGILLIVIMNVVLFRWNNQLENDLLPRTDKSLKEISKVPFLSIAFDSQNRSWVGGRFGVNEYENGKLIRSFLAEEIGAFENDEHYSSGSIFLYIDALDRPWLVVNNNVSVLENGKWKTYTSDFLDIESGGISTLILDSDNRLWIGTYYDLGVRIVDEGSVMVLTVQNSELSNNHISEIAIDKTGKIWIATLGGGINVVDGNNWRIYDEQDSPLLSNYVNAIAFDKDNQAWVGTNSGLNIFDGENWQSFTQRNSGMLHNNIRIIKFTLNNRVWLGDEVVLDGTNWGFYFIPAKIFEETWHQSYFDNEGNLLLSEIPGGMANEVKLVPVDVRLASRFELLLHNLVASGGLLFFSILILEIWFAFLLNADKILWKNLLFSGCFSILFLGITSYDPLLLVVSNIGFIVSICVLSLGVVALLSNYSRRSQIISMTIGWFWD